VPADDTAPGQAAASSIAAEASAGYHGIEPADTHTLAEESSLTLAAAATMLDDAEMENIFGCNIARRNWNHNRTMPTLDRTKTMTAVNRSVVGGVASTVGGSAANVVGVAAL